MSISPIITFKAGICDFDSSTNPPSIKPKATPGYLYLFEEDELIHFCWRPRSASLSQPELDLTMVPTDGHFLPYQLTKPGSDQKSPTNGRIFVLSFQSSTQKHVFWLQSKSQHPSGDASWFSPRDLKHGEIVDRLLQGDEIDVQEEVANISNDQAGQGDGADHMDIDDVRAEGQGDTAGSRGSDEGGASRGGGTNSGQSTSQGSNDAASKAVQDFLKSMQGNQALTNPQANAQGKLFTTLPELLPPAITIPIIDSGNEALVDNLLSHLPPQLLLLNQEVDDLSSVDPNSETAKAAMEALSMGQKREILRKVLRSPQFTQSLGSLTHAIRDGGLPSISEALGIPVENGGFLKRGGVPVGGGEAVEAFVKGVKGAVEAKGDADSQMDTAQ
ncbi:hypothetical protein G7Y79_00013g035150 [Physcia stellaris]|nr:hypothetical protein G7Y79_00013g035150 [Physcia stellaris]